MVIEYIGELIRNEVANKREKLYEQQNRGIYMFRLDEEYVVDVVIFSILPSYLLLFTFIECCSFIYIYLYVMWKIFASIERTFV
jgi:hypothetical protein